MLSCFPVCVRKDFQLDKSNLIMSHAVNPGNRMISPVKPIIVSVISHTCFTGILYEQNLQPADAMVCYKKAVELSRNLDGEGYYDPIAKLQVNHSKTSHISKSYQVSSAVSSNASTAGNCYLNIKVTEKVFKESWHLGF